MAFGLPVPLSGETIMQQTIYLEAAGTNVDADAYKLVQGAPGQQFAVEKAEIVDWDGVTAHAANYITATLKHGSTSLASRNTSTGSGSTLTALTEEALSGAVGTIVTAGDYLHLDVNKSGTGPAFNVQVAVSLRAIL